MTRDARNTDRWRKLSRQILAASSSCYLCGQAIDLGLPTNHPMAGTVDHIAEIEDHPELAFDPSNLQAAHRRCNSIKANKMRAQRNNQARIDFLSSATDTPPPSLNLSPRGKIKHPQVFRRAV